jgi:hypothetical protein
MVGVGFLVAIGPAIAMVALGALLAWALVAGHLG